MTKKRLQIVDVNFENLGSTEVYENSSSDNSDGEKDYPLFTPRTDSNKKFNRQRNRQKRIGKRYKTETSIDKIRRDIASGCCKSKCLKQFTDVGIQTFREEFYGKTNRDQSEFIVHQLRLTLVYDQPNANVTLAVHGKAVCLEAWRKVFGIKRRRYSSVKNQVTKYDDVSFEDPRTGQMYPTKKYFSAHQFLKEYAKQFGEDQPNSPEIHLPPCVTKSSVYSEYQLKCQTSDQSYILISRFYEIWASDFHHVKIRKFQTFTQCIECTNFKTSLLKKTSKEEKKKIMEMRSVHLNLQRLCRQKYYKHNNKAQEEPEHYLSLIIDGMDQSKTNLPRFYNVTKADCTLSRMHHHITGVLCQSSQLNSYAFTSTDRFSSDSDITLNCLMRVLDDISKKRNGCLPPTLYVQADNCAKDNKNNYVLMFLCQLVRAKIFKKVKLNFLMVGHTHEDIDQMFSRISSKLNKTSTETLPKLHEAIQQSFTPMPHVEHFESVWHCKGQFEGCRKIVGLKAPHVFRFKLGEDGNVQVSVKDWPLRDEEYRITDIPEIPDITNDLNIVVPRVDKIMPIVNAISSDLRKYHAAGRLTTEDVEWWQNYLQKLQSSRTIRPCIPMLTGLPKYRSIQRSHHSDMESSLRQALNAQIEKLQHVSALTLSRQRIRI